MRAWLLAGILLLAVSSPVLAGEEDEGEDEGDNENEDDNEHENDNEGDDDDGDFGEIPDDVYEAVVITATGEPRLLDESPIPVRIIDEESIRKSAAGDAADLLQRAPGIPVMSHGVDQRGGVSGISLQGVPAGRTLVLLDGRPVTGDVGGIVDLSQFPADMLERVEIVEGPMSALYGSDALGGVINLITKKPKPGSSISGRVTGSSTPSLDLGGTLSSAQADGLAFGATVTSRLSDSLDLDPDDLATDLDRRRSVGLRLFAALRRSKNRLELSGMYNHDARDGVFLRTNNAIGHVAVYDGRKRHDRFDGSVSWRHTFRPEVVARWELDATDYAFSFDEDLRDSPVASIRRARSGSVSGRFRLDVRALPWASVLLGVEGRRESLRVFVDSTEPGGIQRHVDEVAPQDEWSVEPWVQADFRIGEALEIVPGVRLSIHDGYTPAVAPSVAIRVGLWRDATLRLSGGRGYRAPSLKDRYLLFDHAALGYVVYGDPELRPESSWGANLSLEQQIATRATIRVGGFVNRLTDLITFVYDGAASSDGLNVYRSTNIAGARTVGGQATAEAKWPWIRTTAAYRFVWAWSDDGFLLPDAPLHGLRATVELTLAKIDLSLYNGVGWESERFVDATQSLRSPGLVRWDIRLEKRFEGRGDLAVFVGVDNVLDMHRDPSTEGDFRPVEGRRVLAGVHGSMDFRPASDAEARP